MALKVEIITHNMEISDSQRTLFTRKVEKLDRYLNEIDHIKLDLTLNKTARSGSDRFVAQITAQGHRALLRTEERSEDVATLAHELGHAIHAMLAGHHSVFTFNACLPLAETASTFGEMMLVDKMLAGESDKAVRRDLLFRQMDDTYLSIMRQAYFAIFEKQAHAMVLQNASVGDLAATYLLTLKEQFGDAVEISQESQWEWVSIPHFYHTPFYVYAYAFGQLLVLALYQQYKAEGEAFKPHYIKLLSAGGSQAPTRVCAEAGIDICSGKFWQGGFDVLNRLVEQLELMG